MDDGETWEQASRHAGHVRRAKGLEQLSTIAGQGNFIKIRNMKCIDDSKISLPIRIFP